MFYKNRQDAGRQLAEKLKQYAVEEPIILALPRGGVVLGYEIAKELKAPLDIVVPRKIGAPNQPEFGIGAIAPNKVQIINEGALKMLGLTENDLKELIEYETKEMERRIKLYRKGLPDINIQGKTVIIVDDGLATGVSTKAALLSIKKMNPKKIILAVPVGPPDTTSRFRQEVDDLICIYEPIDFYAVGGYYEDFSQISDEEVIDLLQKSKD